MPDFLYRRDGDVDTPTVYTPTEWAGSPWSRELQHGGPVCGLVASAAEAAAAETGLRVVRLGVDLCRPTPREPLALAWQYLRRGRRLALIEVRLRHVGPAVWATTPLDLVAGQPTSSLVRAAMLSDLTFALSGRLQRRRGLAGVDLRLASFINADMTLYLERPPEGDWILQALVAQPA
jgi:hypothetical protein